MAQVEHVAEMQVGDFIQLPAREWHDNLVAKAKYAEAQAITAAHTDEATPAPQYQVEFQGKLGPELQRIR